nr:hypothetical protein BDOA9_0159940 [Bradyrhizobium sp. DOA9]
MLIPLSLMIGLHRCCYHAELSRRPKPRSMRPSPAASDRVAERLPSRCCCRATALHAVLSLSSPDRALARAQRKCVPSRVLGMLLAAYSVQFVIRDRGGPDRPAWSCDNLLTCRTPVPAWRQDPGRFRLHCHVALT